MKLFVHFVQIMNLWIDASSFTATIYSYFWPDYGWPYLAQINQNFQADSEQHYIQSSKHYQTLTHNCRGR